MRSHVSFATRAVVALALLLGFYLLAITLAGILLYLPYAEVAHLHRFSPRLSIMCLAGAFAILRGCIFLKTPTFHAPGPEVHESDQPELFALIRDIAARMKTRMPVHVYLVPDVNAFVAEVGGFMGFGTTRVMGIGLGLLSVADVSGLRGTLAHELGHFTGGDTALGGLVYRTRVAIVRVRESLNGGVLSKPFELYGSLYLRVTHAISRHQELEADRASVAIAGRDAHVDNLTRTARGAVLFGGFIRSEIGPLCEEGMCPKPLYEGLARFIERAPREKVDEALASAKTDPHDTHPALADRIAFARALPDPNVPRDTRPAVALLQRPSDVEAILEPYLFEPLGVQGALQRIAWEEVTSAFYAPRLAEEARVAAERLYPILRAGPAYGNVVASFAAALPSHNHYELARALEPKMAQVPSAMQQELTAIVLGRALGVLSGAALVERGGAWRTAIGDPLTVERDGERHEPFKLAQAAVKSKEGLDGFLAQLGSQLPAS